MTWIRCIPVATGSRFWPQKRVLATGTIAELLKVDDPWIHEYFHGPRPRRILDRRRQGAGLMETKANYVLIGAFTILGFWGSCCS